MLPPRNLHTHCIRCHAALDEDQRICGRCGADRVIEMEIAGDLHPALASLRRWLLIVGGVFAFIGFLNYSHYGRALPTVFLVMPFAVAGGFFVLYAVAGRIPMAASVVALTLFLGHWVAQWFVDPGSIFNLDMMLALRVMSMLILIDGVVAASRARALRRRAAVMSLRAKARANVSE